MATHTIYRLYSTTGEWEYEDKDFEPGPDQLAVPLEAYVEMKSWAVARDIEASRLKLEQVELLKENEELKAQILSLENQLEHERTWE